MKDYVVKTSTGERRSNLTREDAIALARRRRAEWAELNRPVEVTVIYNPTGQEVIC